MSAPLISIIIPVYNSGDTVRRITSSILKQQIDFELILVNDGSTDNTHDILTEIKDKDQRVRIFSKKNGGPSSARNAGLEKVRGEYVIFFDADDDIHPETFKSIPSYLQTVPADLWVFGWTTEVRQSKRVVKGKTITPNRESFKGNSEDIKKFVIRSIGGSGQLYNLWNKVYRADIIQESRVRFREDMRFGEDLIFTFHYANHVRHIELFPDILYQYQANSETSLFSSSALVPEHRLINAEELDRFAGQDRDKELDDITNWVHWRWLISYSLILSKSELPYAQKVSKLVQVLNLMPRVAASSRYIGYKKLLIEKVFSVLQRSPLFLLGSAKVVNAGKAIGLRLSQAR